MAGKFRLIPLLSLFLLVCLFAAPWHVLAIPLPPHPFTIDQPDGTTLEVTGVGDEYGMIVETIDGYTIVPGPGGWWQYASRAAEGTLTPSGIVPGKGNPAALGITPHLRQSAAEAAKAREWREASARSRRLNPKLAERKRLVFENAGSIAWAPGGEAAAQEASAALAPTSFRLAVLLIEFPATLVNGTIREFPVPHTYTPEQITQLLLSNGTYTVSPLGNSVYGSMRDYYATASYGKFELSGQVFPWVTADYGRSYYLDTAGGDAILRQEAIAKSGVDLSQFDGHVVVWAGKANSGNLWPHASLTDGWYMTSEKFNAEEDLSVIGVHCHEFGHVLGLPDLYYDPTVDRWGLMGNGASGGGTAPTGWRPVQLFSAEKEELGWAFPATVIDGIEGNFSLRAWNDYPDAVKVVSQRSVFYLENRQKTGYDADLAGEGVLVLHLNRVSGSAPIHVEAADGTAGYDAGDPYPGASGNTSFGCATTPSGIDLDGTCSISVTGISVTDGTAGFWATADWPLAGAGINIDGSGDYPTLFTAIEVAVPGQTVRVPARTFDEQVMMRSGISVRGEGPGRTVLLAATAGEWTVRGADDTTFSGFTIRGITYPAYGLYAGQGLNGNMRIVNNTFENNDEALFTAVYSPYAHPQQYGKLIVANNIFYRNNLAFVGNPDQAFLLFNNVFQGNQYALYQSVAGVPTYLADYNDFYGNTTDFHQVARRDLGRNNLYKDPLFSNAAVGDYSLQAGSPCIDAGNPDPAWNDLDGSRNDVAVFGGPSAPAAVSPPVRTAGAAITDLGTYLITQDSNGQTVTWIATSTFQRGETVVFRVKVLDNAGLPVAGAVVNFDISGPQSLQLSSGLTAADGTADARWTTTLPDRKGNGGTIPGAYSATISSVTGTNFTWNGIYSSVYFTIQ